MRTATRSDIPAMVALFKRHHGERAFAFPFDDALVAADIAAAIDNPDALCLVDEGCALVAVSFRPMFTPDRVAVEIMLRCEQPAVRPRLVETLEAWARERGCRRAALASTHSYEAFKRLYRRDGYVPAEMTFAKEL